MLIKFFLCFVIFISSIQNSFGLHNLSDASTNPVVFKDSSVVKQPKLSQVRHPPRVVYRVDSRNLAEIRGQGGFSTWAANNDEPSNNNLADHVEGNSIRDGNSNFISTAATFAGAMHFAASVYRSMGDDYTPLYMYRIRPDHHFFDVEASLGAARNHTQSYWEREELAELLEDLGGYDEFVSHGSIGVDRIIDVSGAITGRFLYENGITANSTPESDAQSPAFDETFAAYQWEANPQYNPAYNNNTASAEIFPNVSSPSMGILTIVDDVVLPIDARFSCYGTGSGPSRFSKVSGAANACAPREKLKLIRVPKSHKMKMVMLTTSLSVIRAS